MIHVTPEEFFGTDHVVELPMEDEYMNENFIPLSHLAARINMDRSRCRKYVLRLGYQPKKLRTRESHGQMVLALTKKEAVEIEKHRNAEYIPGY